MMDTMDLVSSSVTIESDSENTECVVHVLQPSDPNSSKLILKVPDSSPNSGVSISSDDLGQLGLVEDSSNPSMLVSLGDMDIVNQEISICDTSTETAVSGSNTVDILISAAHPQLDENKNKNEVINIAQNWFTSKVNKQTLQEGGHKWKQGQWTSEENEILRTNINNYCQVHNIPNPTEIIFETAKDKRKNFYRVVGRGIQRPLFSIYRRVLRMYDSKNHIGKYSPQEIEKLKSLRYTHGNDWSAIGAILGRSAGSVRDRARLMKDSCRYGTWQHDEEMRLANAVYELSGAQPGQEVHSGLCWANVAQKVNTRTEKQCRAKWLNFLNWKEKGGVEWVSPSDDITFLLKIISQGASDESQVDWAELSKGWACARSPQWLRNKWWTLKRTVPGYQTLPFSEIVQILTDMTTNGTRPHRYIDKTSLAGSDSLSQDKSLSVSKFLPFKFSTSDGLRFTRYSNSDGDAILLPHTVQLPDGTHAVLSEELGAYACLSTGSEGAIFIHDEAEQASNDSSMILLSSNTETSKTDISAGSSLGSDTLSAQEMSHIVLLEEDMPDSMRNGCQSILVSHLSDPLLNSNSSHHDLHVDN